MRSFDQPPLFDGFEPAVSDLTASTSTPQELLEVYDALLAAGDHKGLDRLIEQYPLELDEVFYEEVRR